MPERSAPMVVNIGKRQPHDVYIGRRNNRYALPESKWANLFRIGLDGTREECIAKYRAYLLSRPDLMAALPDLAGMRLGCWCAPAPCHGDVLKELVEALPSRDELQEEFEAYFTERGRLLEEPASNPIKFVRCAYCGHEQPSPDDGFAACEECDADDALEPIERPANDQTS